MGLATLATCEIEEEEEGPGNIYGDCTVLHQVLDWNCDCR